MSDKRTTVCFSGHRARFLPDGGAADNPVNLRIKSLLFDKITQCIAEGKINLITGCASGVDIWAAETVLQLKRGNPNLSLICAVPFPGHDSAFSAEEKWRLNLIYSASDEKIIVSPEYSPECYKRRNCYMVDRSSVLIAVADSLSSGTGQTVRYAYKSGVDVRLINIAGLRE